MRATRSTRTASRAALLAVAFAVLAGGARPLRAPAEEEAAPAASPRGEAVVYRHGDVELEGWLALPESKGPARRTAVLLVHAWRGHGDFVRQVAADWAAKGYVAFALDMYGRGVYAQDNAEAARRAKAFYEDPALMRARARAGLDVLRARDDVDPERVVAMGFCFGGKTVLEMARDGAPLAAVVSFHGGLDTKQPAKEGEVKAEVLVCHGGDDPHVPPAQVNALWEELKAARVVHQILVLSGAVHSFTDPAAGDDPSRGSAYCARAAALAWDAAERLVASIAAR